MQTGESFIKTKICSFLSKIGWKWAASITVSFIFGVVAHYYLSDSNWLSGVFFVVFGALVSAVTVIYVIREDLSRRASIANPVLQLLRDYIVNMALNLDFHVVNAGKNSSINDKLISKDEATILDAMETLHKDIKDMSEKGLNKVEKKAI